MMFIHTHASERCSQVALQFPVHVVVTECSWERKLWKRVKVTKMYECNTDKLGQWDTLCNPFYYFKLCIRKFLMILPIIQLPGEAHLRGRLCAELTTKLFNDEWYVHVSAAVLLF